MSIFRYRWCFFPTTGQLPVSARFLLPSFLATDEADANLDEYLPDGTPMTAVYRSLLLNLPTKRHFLRLPLRPCSTVSLHCCRELSSQTRPLPEKEVVGKRRRVKESHQTPIASVQPLCSLPFHPRQPLYAANYQRTISTSCFGFYLSISSRLSRFNLADRPPDLFSVLLATLTSSPSDSSELLSRLVSYRSIEG